MNKKKIMLILIIYILKLQQSYNQIAPIQYASLFNQFHIYNLVINGTYPGYSGSYGITYKWNFTFTHPQILIGIKQIRTNSPVKSLGYTHWANCSTNLNGTLYIQVYNGMVLQYLTYYVMLYYGKQYGYQVFKKMQFDFIVNSTTTTLYPSATLYNASFQGIINASNPVGEMYMYQYSPQYKISSPPQTNKFIYFLSKIQLTSTLGNMNKLSLTPIPGPAGSNNFTMVMYKPLGIVISKLSYSAIVYSTANLTYYANQNGFAWGGLINSTGNGKQVTTGSNLPVIPLEFFAGLSFFKPIDDDSVLDFKMDLYVSSYSSIIIYPQSPYNSSQHGSSSTLTGYFHGMTLYCSPDTYVFNLLDNLYYPTCPASTFLFNNNVCYPCPKNCLTCSLPIFFDWGQGVTGNCSSCNVTEYRAFINGSCNCVNSTYFDDGYSATCRTCASVVIGTSTCTFQIDQTLTSNHYSQLFAGNWTTNVLPLYTSLACNTGYVLSNKLCTTCNIAIQYCIACDNSSQCTTCNSSAPATKYTDGKCYLCSLVNCTTCKQNNVCDQCISGYIPATNGSCIIQPCNSSCICGGYSLPKVNGNCTTTCGDAIKVGSQQCDDGNTVDHDGCSSVCKIQTCNQNCSCSGWHFPLINNSCSFICGDGFKVGSQACDDGNLVNHDGCSSICVIQLCSQNCSCSGYLLPLVNDSCSTLCGDGIIAGLQQCDDGNTISGDGCSSSCKTQNCSALCTCGGWAFPKVNGICSPLCGDGLLKGSEQCDDGNIINYDGCSFDCKIQGCNKTCNCSGWGFPRVNGLCSTTCGDYFQAGTQECDDGNLFDFDGCSAICKLQPCNVKCNCQGWYLPRTNNQCKSICGDGIKTNTQQCDDGNINSHDGCNSLCKIQTSCNQSCLCNGWQKPFINGSCSTVCGDGIIQGIQACDDGNSVSGDGCSSLCQIDKIQSYSIFSEQQTYYPSLILFGMGFRIVGMQMLWVYQSLQLMLQVQSDSIMHISHNIHGFSNSETFPFKVPGLGNQLFDKFNYMFFLILFIFAVCALLETLGGCFQNGNQVANSSESISPRSFSKSPHQKKQYKFQDERDDEGNNDFTVHYEKKSTYKNDLLSETRMNSQMINQFSEVSQPPTFLTRLSRIILRQLFFDLIINVQPAILSGLISQIISNGFQSIINFPTLLTIGIVQLFFICILAFCKLKKQFFGENQDKFKEQKFMNYWIVTSLEKILMTVIIGSKFQFYIYFVIGIKLCVFIYFWFTQLFNQKLQHYRAVAIQLLHFILLSVFTINKVYLEPTGIRSKLPQHLIQTTYTVILGTILFITILFYIKQIKHKCSQNSQISNENYQAGPDRIFYSKRQLQQSGLKLKSKKNQLTESIIEEIKTSKTMKNKALNSSRSKNTIRKERENNDRIQNESDNSQNIPQKVRQQIYQRDERNNKSRYNKKQQDFQITRYNKSNAIKSTRRYGHQKDNNKQNKSYKTNFDEESEPDIPDGYKYTKSLYRVQNSNQINSSKIKGSRSFKGVKSRKNMRQQEQYEDDNSNNYNSISLRYR